MWSTTRCYYRQKRWSRQQVAGGWWPGIFFNDLPRVQTRSRDFNCVFIEWKHPQLQNCVFSTFQQNIKNVLPSFVMETQLLFFFFFTYPLVHSRTPFDEVLLWSIIAAEETAHGRSLLIWSVFAWFTMGAIVTLLGNNTSLLFYKSTYLLAAQTQQSR